LAHSAAEKSQIIVEALSKVPLLKDLTKNQLSKISDSVEIIPFQAGDVIVRKGTEGNVFYIIKEGQVKISNIGDGKTYQDHDLTVGDFFGERALITGEPRAANVTALTKVVLMALDRVSFDSLLGPLKDLLDLNMQMRVVNNIHYFSRLKDDDKGKVCKAFKLEKFTPNSSVIREGEKGNKLYVLREGQLRSEAPNGTTKILTAGAYFGESAMLEEETRKTTVVAITECEVFSLTRSDLKSIFKDKSKESGKEEKRVLTTAAPENSTLRPEIKISDLQDLRKTLGSGTFGKVTLVQHRTSKEVYALKAMLKSELVAHKQQNNVMNEKNVMLMCNHPFILKLFQTFKDSKRLYMLLEFVQGGELFAVLHTAHSDGVSDSQAKFYAAGVTLALEYLHSLVRYLTAIYLFTYLFPYL
jgi:cGMP-dependent protein kinase